MPITYLLRKPITSCLFVILILSSLGTQAGAQALNGFPYTNRTRPYQGWTALVKGDNNSVGMSGATVALPANISSMENNPAGFAMYLNGLAALVNKNSVSAPELNHSENSITEYQWGIGTSAPPWGFGLTYYSPSSENVDGSEVSVRQVRLSMAYLVNKNLSVGASVEMAKAIRTFDGDDLGAGWYSTQIGALYKFDNHWVLGASFHPGLDIPASPDLTSHATALGFNQVTKVPSILTVGIGFMPNRFFKAGLSLLGVAGTPDTALLYDESFAYGQRFTLQPRVGASYVFMQYQNWSGEIAVGSYFQVARVETYGNRLHGTFSVDINPYFINTGFGADLSSSYKNWMISLGIDIVRLARTAKIIPPDNVPPLNGTFPKMLVVDADGMPDGFTQGEEKSVSPPTAQEVRQIVQDIPKRIQEQLGGKPGPTPKKSKHKKKR